MNNHMTVFQKSTFGKNMFFCLWCVKKRY